MNCDINEKINELSGKMDFLFDVLNQLEVVNIIPSEILERSRNRLRLDELKTENEKNPSDSLSNEIKKCMKRELILHNKIKEIVEKN